MSSKDIASSDESTAGCSSEITDDLAAKKLKQSPEDKRKRNYIAVRKHRQLLKNTLDECPVTLVKLTKEHERLVVSIDNDQTVVEGLDELIQLVKQRQPQPEPEETETVPSASSLSRRKGSPEEEGEDSEENKFKRPKRMFPDGVPQELLHPQPLLSSVFNSPLLQPGMLSPLLFPTSSPFNFISSPLVSSHLFNPLIMTTSTPLQSPVLRQPPMILTADMVQNMMTQSNDIFPSPLLHSAVRTGPIQFTPDNVDYLWQMCNEQLK